MNSGYADARDTRAEPIAAIDSMIGTTLENLRQVRGTLGALVARISPRPMTMAEGKMGASKEPSLTDLAIEARDVSAECAKTAQEIESMLFQSSRAGSAIMPRVG
jgi:hypothetical protein